MGETCEMKSDIGALKAYMAMLLDGTAFSNWKNPPDAPTRAILVESIMKGKSFNETLDFSDIKKVVTESKSTKDLKRLMDEMLIKEDEFKV